MNKFIDSQINIFNSKKYNIYQNINTIKLNNNLLVVEIKENKLIVNLENDFLGRKKMINLIFEKLLKKYKLKDTIILINLRDGYYWESDLPVFNFAVPIGKKGLIFPNFDFCDFDLLESNYDQIKDKFKEYIPKKIENDLYFKGRDASIKKCQIREKLSEEKRPFNVIASKNYSESLYKVKDHKYLLDLSGVKPQSLRFKYLLLAERVVFRISFYNPEIGENGYFRQFYDYILNDKEDYVHLIYKLNYDQCISNSLYEKIKKDILNKYTFFEKNPDEYIKIVNSLNKKIKKININSMLKYLYQLISEYTDKIL